MSTDYFAQSEIKNLVATAIKKSKSIDLDKLPEDPDVQAALQSSLKKFPKELAKRINSILLNPVNSLEDGQACFDGLLYVVGLKNKVEEEAAAAALALGAPRLINKAIQGSSWASTEGATWGGFLKSTLSSAATSVIYNPMNAQQIVTDKELLANSIATPTASFLQKEYVSKNGVIKDNLPGGTLVTAVSDLVKGNFAGAGATILTGAGSIGITTMLKSYLTEVGTVFGLPLGVRKNPFANNDVNLFASRSIAKTSPNADIKHNVGHGLKVSVTLGGLQFALPPATTSNMHIHGGMHGQISPGAEAGIRFEHIQNFASLMIPGSVPVYQSLGVQGLVIEFVGAFLGYDAARKLNNNTSVTVNEDRTYQRLQEWPDPPQLKNVANREGGSWEVSRDFADKVVEGVPMEFVILNSVADLATKIKYKVIVLNYTRWYRDKGRTYYRFRCLAVNSSESGRNASTKTPDRAVEQKTVTRAEQNSGSGTNTGAITGATRSELVTTSDKTFDTLKTLLKDIGQYISNVRAQTSTMDLVNTNRAALKQNAFPYFESSFSEANNLFKKLPLVYNPQKVDKLRSQFEAWKQFYENLKKIL